MKIVDLLEPAAKLTADALFALPDSEAKPEHAFIPPLQSIAISLKRIADAMTEPTIAGIELLPPGFETVDDKRHREFLERGDQRHAAMLEAITADRAVLLRIAEAFDSESGKGSVLWWLETIANAAQAGRS